MKDHSTMTRRKFLAETIWKSLIAIIWYQHLLFRCLPGMTYAVSKGLLWGSLLLSVVLGTFLVFRHRRTAWTSVVCVVLPLGIYTVLTYLHTFQAMIKSLLLAAGVVSLLCMAMILFRRIRKSSWKNRRKVWCYRFRRSLFAIQSSYAAAFLAIMLLLAVGGVFGTGILQGTALATVGVVSEEQTIHNNMDILYLLQEEEWEKLNTTQKINVLQCVANIESRYLGLPNELNVVMANLQEGTLGMYIDRTHTICLDLDHLEQDPAYAVVESLCHEAFHSYEHRLVDVYNELDSDARKLRIYGRVARYAEEFADYSDAADFGAYYNQYCETDSREYALGAVQDYYEKISAYLQES